MSHNSTTHVARKLIGGEMTLSMLLLKLTYGEQLDGVKAILTDEVSMMSSKHLDRLDTLLRRRLNRPFGGLDIILVGHMKQLPVPDPNAEPLVTSLMFRHFKPITLLNNFRHQADPVYAKILNKIESYYKYGGDIKSQHKARAVLPKILTNDELELLQARKTPRLEKGSIITPIHHTNKAVSHSNKTLSSFTVGNEIIVRFNVKRKDYQMHNGDRHLIQAVTDKAIKFNDIWFSKDYTVKQKDEKFPRIQLSASFTIHCSQGQTLDTVYIHPRNLTMNLLYVAMSRVRKLEDLYLFRL